MSYIHDFVGLMTNKAEAVEQGAAAISADPIKSVVDLLQLLSRSDDTSYFSPSRLHAVAELISAVAWPLVIIVGVLIFKSETKSLIRRVKKVGIAGTSLEAEEEIHKRVELSAQEVLSSSDPIPPVSLSIEDVKRSAKVEELSKGAEPDTIRAQIDAIAAEYESIRANMPSGSARTKQMGAVMAKMRTLGRAAHSFRKELSESSSPGKKLFAIAVLQMQPDYDMLEWLGSATGNEPPFIQFQALIALQVAVRNAGPAKKRLCVRALALAKSGLSASDRDTSRWSLAEQIQQELSEIPDQTG